MSKTIFKPTKNFILVTVKENVEQEIGGLVMPASIESGLKKAIVVEVGPLDDTTSGIQPGNTVVVPQNLRNEFKISGVKHYLLPIEEIYAIEREIN